MSESVAVSILGNRDRDGRVTDRTGIATLMFTDIEGFSRISETMEPELLTSRLSRYFEALGAAISGNHGMIDKYIGDSIMAFWNAPEPDEDHIANACRAALQAAAASRQLSDKWLNLGPEAGAPAGGWWSCFVYYMGVWVLMMFTFDYARFGREEDAGYHAWFNFGTPFYAMAFLVSGLFGMFMIGTVPDLGALSEVSVLLALLKLMGIWGLLFVWVTQTRINTANYYLAAVNLEALVQLFGRLPFGRIGWAIAVGAIVYVLMLADVFTYLLSALAYQGIFVVAWVAVAMAHILIDRYTPLVGSVIEYRSSHVPAFNPLGIAAWFVAAAVGIWLHVWGGAYAELSAPATAVIAFAIYATGLTQARRSWFLAAG